MTVGYLGVVTMATIS